VAKRSTQSTDFAAFNRRMKKIAVGIENGVNKVKQEAARQVLVALVANTPVDVGTARSNWMVTIGSPAIGTRRAFSPIPSRWKPHKGVFPGGSKGETRNRLGAVQTGMAVIVRAKPEQTIFVANSLPYIGRLNRGHSKQSSPGWVNRAFLKAAANTRSKISPIMNKEIS